MDFNTLLVHDMACDFSGLRKSWTARGVGRPWRYGFRVMPISSASGTGSMTWEVGVEGVEEAEEEEEDDEEEDDGGFIWNMLSAVWVVFRSVDGEFYRINLGCGRVRVRIQRIKYPFFY